MLAGLEFFEPEVALLETVELVLIEMGSVSVCSG
jgi:hypothetical protein